MTQKRFEVVPHVGILDNLTGKVYTNKRDLCDLMNKEDKRRNEITEKYYDFLYNY